MASLRMAFRGVLAGAMLFLPAMSQAQTVEDFYRGKTVSMIVSSSAGGGYDVLSRAIARHMSRHLPGNPPIIVRQMPGAGGIVATKHLYSSASRDGTVIGGVQNNAPLEPLFGTKEADYDATRLNWLGTPSVETGLIFVWADNPTFKSLDDMKRHEMSAGASGVNSAPAFYSRILNELLGTKIKVIAGYPGQNEAYLAIERGELDTYGLTMWSSLASTKQQWLRDKKIRVLVQFGPVKEDEIRDVPFGPDLVKNQEDRQLFEAAYGPLLLGRPFLMPPDVAADRVKAMRDAMFATFKDREFIEEAEKLKLQVDRPSHGEQLQADVERLYRTPSNVVARLRKIANP